MMKPTRPSVPSEIFLQPVTFIEAEIIASVNVVTSMSMTLATPHL